MKEKSKITSKGQVTIPKDVRECLGLKPGDEIEFVEDNGVFRVQKRLLVSPFKKYRGYLRSLAGRNPDDLVERMRGQRSLPSTPTSCSTSSSRMPPMAMSRNAH